MDITLVKEIIACLPRGQTAFDYAKDAYALELLKRVHGTQARIGDIKKTRWGRLLNKPALKAALGRSGGLLHKLETPSREQTFVLSLGYWGSARGQSWKQTSRPGYNLVLQLNFPPDHDARYAQLVKPRTDALFNYQGHPVLRRGKREFFHETLAWARIDLDFHTGEALIEEIQSDWVREAKSAIDTRIRHRHKWEGRYWARKMGGTVTQLREYSDTVLAPYATLWDEAMLFAAIRFVHDELGLKRIYYHGFETGAAAKRITYTLPPRSLYTDLPRRLCFEKTTLPPAFLWHDADFRRRVRRVSNRHWYRMIL